MRLAPLTVFLVGLALPAQASPANDGPFAPERLPVVAALLEGEVHAGRHAGLSYLLVHGEHVVTGAFGVADVATGRPLQRDTIVRLYSMTKPITAVAALCLVEDGVLAFDLPIGGLVPEFAAPRVFVSGTADAPELVAATRPITVRMLLTHTAGFTYDFYRDSPVAELYRRAGLWESATLDEFAARAAALPLVAEPGEKWQYGIADDVLGLVIERAAKQPLADFVRTRVTGPLRMVDTDYDVPAAKRQRLASLHERTQGKLAVTEPTFGSFAEPGRGFAAGGAGMFSTLDDYARFARFLVGDGTLDGVRVLGRKTLELARRDALRGEQRTGVPGDGWGLIAAVSVDPAANSRLWSTGTLHWGGAATTSFFADPQEGLVGVVFAQHFPYDEHKLFERFRTAVYQALR